MGKNGIAFKAILSKAQTTIDGGWKISFDVSQDDTQEILELVQFRDQVIQLAAIPVDSALMDMDSPIKI